MLNIKEKTIKIGGICLAVVIAAGGMGTAVYAKGAKKDVLDSDTETQIKEALESIWKSPDEEGEISKEETVYVLTDSNGSVRRIIVSDWIKNVLEEMQITDRTELLNIMEVTDGESYTQKDGDTYVWDTQGNDIYYQGDIEKELPISLAISYTIDGKEIQPEELAGKSGHVVIRYEFENHQSEMADVDGKKEEIYVPFATVTGMILDNTQFKNISISSGKVVNDGSRSVVVGIAFPGLSQNLDLDSEESEKLPGFVEIEADVTDFALGSTYTVATNELFNRLNLDDVDDLDELKDAMSELTDAMTALMDGSSELYDGLAELYEKSGDLKNGVDQLVDGSNKLADGAAELSNGTKSLQSGAATLASGLNTLTSKNSELTGGAAQVFNTLLDTANTQLAASGLDVPTLTIDNYGTVLNGVLASLNADTVYDQVYAAVYAAVTEQVNANEAAIRAGVTQAVREQVLAEVLAAAGIDRTMYEATVSGGDAGNPIAAQINAIVDNQMQSENVQNTIAELVEAQKATLISENMQKADTQNLISQKVAEATGSVNEGAAKIAGLKAQLDSYNTFYQGLIAYTAGVSTASAGAGQLSSGAGQLASGANTLSAGVNELKDGIGSLAEGSKALIDGVEKLKDGGMQLRDGLIMFDEEGIEKLVSAFDGDYDELFDRLKATVDASENYRSFAGIAEEMSGGVKFIYKIDEIK